MNKDDIDKIKICVLNVLVALVYVSLAVLCSLVFIAIAVYFTYNLWSIRIEFENFVYVCLIVYFSVFIITGLKYSYEAIKADGAWFERLGGCVAATVVGTILVSIHGSIAWYFIIHCYYMIELIEKKWTPIYTYITIGLLVLIMTLFLIKYFRRMLYPKEIRDS